MTIDTRRRFTAHTAVTTRTRARKGCLSRRKWESADPTTSPVSHVSASTPLRPSGLAPHVVTLRVRVDTTPDNARSLTVTVLGADAGFNSGHHARPEPKGSLLCPHTFCPGTTSASSSTSANNSKSVASKSASLATNHSPSTTNTTAATSPPNSWPTHIRRLPLPRTSHPRHRRPRDPLPTQPDTQPRRTRPSPPMGRLLPLPILRKPRLANHVRIPLHRTTPHRTRPTHHRLLRHQLGLRRHRPHTTMISAHTTPHRNLRRPPGPARGGRDGLVATHYAADSQLESKMSIGGIMSDLDETARPIQRNSARPWRVGADNDLDEIPDHAPGQEAPQ